MLKLCLYFQLGLGLQLEKLKRFIKRYLYIYLLHILQQLGLLIYTLITYLIVFPTSSDQVIKFETVSKL